MYRHMQTNKPFDYYIPEEFIGHIEIGMRVVVPFGTGISKGLSLV